MTLFDDEFLKKLEYLNIISKRLFAGQHRAERRTRKRGTGLEFADYRAYVPGDDFRHLDWKAYLRLNRLILKLFEEEEDLPIYIFVDSSQSMNYGQPYKARLRPPSRCRFVLHRSGEPGPRQCDLVRGRRRNRKCRRSAARAASSRFSSSSPISLPGGETDARTSFKTYCTETRRRGLAVVISDMFDGHGFEAALDILRHFRHDIFVLHIASHEEIDPGLAGRTPACGRRKQCQTREITITPSLLTAYRARMQSICEGHRILLRKISARVRPDRTDFPFEELVLKVFRQGRFLK